MTKEKNDEFEHIKLQASRTLANLHSSANELVAAIESCQRYPERLQGLLFHLERKLEKVKHLEQAKSSRHNKIIELVECGLTPGLEVIYKSPLGYSLQVVIVKIKDDRVYVKVKDRPHRQFPADPGYLELL